MCTNSAAEGAEQAMRLAAASDKVHAMREGAKYGAEVLEQSIE
jgi:hypothetical protein